MPKWNHHHEATGQFRPRHAVHGFRVATPVQHPAAQAPVQPQAPQQAPRTVQQAPTAPQAPGRRG